MVRENYLVCGCTSVLRQRFFEQLRVELESPLSTSHDFTFIRRFRQLGQNSIREEFWCFREPDSGSPEELRSRLFNHKNYINCFLVCFDVSCFDSFRDAIACVQYAAEHPSKQAVLIGLWDGFSLPFHITKSQSVTGLPLNSPALRSLPPSMTVCVSRAQARTIGIVAAGAANTHPSQPSSSSSSSLPPSPSPSSPSSGFVGNTASVSNVSSRYTSCIPSLDHTLFPSLCEEITQNWRAGATSNTPDTSLAESEILDENVVEDSGSSSRSPSQSVSSSSTSTTTSTVSVMASELSQTAVPLLDLTDGTVNGVIGNTVNIVHMEQTRVSNTTAGGELWEEEHAVNEPVTPHTDPHGRYGFGLSQHRGAAQNRRDVEDVEDDGEEVGSEREREESGGGESSEHDDSTDTYGSYGGSDSERWRLSIPLAPTRAQTHHTQTSSAPWPPGSAALDGPDTGMGTTLVEEQVGVGSTSSQIRHRSSRSSRSRSCNCGSNSCCNDCCSGNCTCSCGSSSCCSGCCSGGCSSFNSDSDHDAYRNDGDGRVRASSSPSTAPPAPAPVSERVYGRVRAGYHVHADGRPSRHRVRPYASSGPRQPPQLFPRLLQRFPTLAAWTDAMSTLPHLCDMFIVPVSDEAAMTTGGITTGNTVQTSEQGEATASPTITKITTGAAADVPIAVGDAGTVQGTVGLGSPQAAMPRLLSNQLPLDADTRACNRGLLRSNIEGLHVGEEVVGGTIAGGTGGSGSHAPPRTRPDASSTGMWSRRAVPRSLLSPIHGYAASGVEALDLSLKMQHHTLPHANINGASAHTFSDRFSLYRIHLGRPHLTHGVASAQQAQEIRNDPSHALYGLLSDPVFPLFEDTVYYPENCFQLLLEHTVVRAVLYGLVCELARGYTLINPMSGAAATAAGAVYAGQGYELVSVDMRAILRDVEAYGLDTVVLTWNSALELGSYTHGKQFVLERGDVSTSMSILRMPVGTRRLMPRPLVETTTKEQVITNDCDLAPVARCEGAHIPLGAGVGLRRMLGSLMGSFRSEYV